MPKWRLAYKLRHTNKFTYVNMYVRCVSQRLIRRACKLIALIAASKLKGVGMLRYMTTPALRLSFTARQMLLKGLQISRQCAKNIRNSKIHKET